MVHHRSWSAVFAVVAAAVLLAIPFASGVLATSLPTRPPLVDVPVPAVLHPSLATAANDYPAPYFDGCNVQTDGKVGSASCLYGNLHSSTTIALFGDSHALGWFPAVRQVAANHGWRMLNLTMSACSPAQINEWIPAWHRISTECARWRNAAMARLIKVRPAIILVTGTRGFAAASLDGTVLAGTARTQAWETGMVATLKTLRSLGSKVILLDDTPITRVDPLTCLPAHRNSLLACSTPVTDAVSSSWLDEEAHVADLAKVGRIDPELWVCPTSPCPVVVGNVLVFRNAGHITATFAATMGARLDKAIAALR